MSPIQQATRPLRALAVALLLGLAACGGSGGKGGPPAPPPYQKVLLNRFPLSLDFLYKTNDPAFRQLVLTGLRNGRPEATSGFLVPYPFYNHSSHFPATLKWYLYTQGATPVSLPAAGFLELSGEVGAKVQTLNGVPCVMDITATYHLSYYIRVTLGHFCADQRLVDAFHAAGNVDAFGQTRHALPVAADTVLGSTLPTGALDFIIADDTHRNFDPGGGSDYYQTWVNPFLYFTPEVQAQIRSAYQVEQDAKNQSGLYPESSLDRSFDLNQPGTFFGSWFYRSGPLQPGVSDHPFGWYSFSGCMVNLQDVARTDRTSFWKDANTGLPFGPDMIGVFCEAVYGGTLPGFTSLGGRYMVRVDGDNQGGILRLDPFFYTPAASPVYLKIQLVEGSSATPWDDQLQAEAFPTLAAARGAFTAARSTYGRMYILQ